MCKVSILVPVYNVEAYLPKCLDSLIGQTLREIEIICIDDGSTDRSGEILDEYAEKDKRIHVVHQDNGGYGKAMNAGLHFAQGEYIGVVESDDFAAPEMFSQLYKAAVQNRAQIVKSNYYRYWDKPKEKIKKEPLLKYLPYKQVIHPWAYQRLFRIQPSIWSGIYQRAFLEQNQIAFLETPGAAYQDTSFTFKVFAIAERIALLSDAFLYYRQDNFNSSIHSAEKAEFVRAEYQEINTFLGQSKKYQTLYRIRNQMMFHTYLWNYVRLKPELCADFLQQMRQDFLQLRESGQLELQEFVKSDKKMLQLLLEQPQEFLQREKRLMQLRGKISSRAYRALLIGCTAGTGAMLQAIMRRLMRK